MSQVRVVGGSNPGRLRDFLKQGQAVVCGLGALAILMLNAGAMSRTQGTSGTQRESVIKPEAYVSQDVAPRGRELEMAAVLKIASGFHMNSNKPSEAYLIPTTLTVEAPKGFRVLATTYPPGSLRKFAFSPDKSLDVYTGSATIRTRLAVLPDAPLGTTVISSTLRYQACNETSCLPPVKIPIMVSVHVVPAGSKSQPVHPELFSR